MERRFERQLELQSLRTFLDGWYDALRDPEKAQGLLLQRLVHLYSETGYGEEHGVEGVKTLSDFRACFPVVAFKDLEPWIARVRSGDYRALLSEEPTGWVMTRGSTGPAKVMPMTQSHEDDILNCGARGFLNYAVQWRDAEVLNGGVLSLSFPSIVHEMEIEGRRIGYGYSSGTYSKLHPGLGGARLIPRQEEIDALGPGISKEDWERRFELTYERALHDEVRSVIGVAPVILSFARFLKRRHGTWPHNLWKIRALFLTSVPKIQFKYAPVMKAQYGASAVVEIYSATEGVFAQQMDTLPYVTPNCDTYLLEACTRGGLKMLHEMKRGEWGSIVISSCLFPRYEIGDLVECMGNGYYRVFGRDKWWVRFEHRGYRALTSWFT